VERVSTDLDACLADPRDELFFDAATTQLRAGLIRRAIEAGKHVYTEKPSAASLEDALDLARLAKRAGIKHGVVQDKLFLPGLRKLKTAIDSGFFGRICSVKGEFGYWVFEGDLQPAQRPSWNYKLAEGGGIILDMLCHWRYVLDNLFGEVEGGELPRRHAHPGADRRGRQALQGRRGRRGLRHLPAPRRRHRAHQLLLGHARRRDDLVTFQVDGTHGSAGGRASRSAGPSRA
jgi:predicted dehydrogenase